MLETLGEYALEQLAAQGERERLQDWLACYCVREAETAEVGLRGPQQLAWVANLTADREKVRADLEWSLQRAREGIRISDCSISGQESSAKNRKVAGSSTLSLKGDSGAGLLAAEVCLRLASALRHYWEWQGHLTEARAWLRATLGRPLWGEIGGAPPSGRAQACGEASGPVCFGK